MSLLPKNEPKRYDVSPRVFFIWGKSMSGKTFLARQFPQPLLLNTDGNCYKVDTPSIYITDFKQLSQILEELKKGSSYKTIILDLIEDIQQMCVKTVCEKFGEDRLGEKNLFGQDWAMYSSLWKDFVKGLTSLINYNIIFISHSMVITENMQEKTVPALKGKDLNVVLGRCDLQLQTSKIGSRYITSITNYRDVYCKKNVLNKDILLVLEKIGGIINE